MEDRVRLPRREEPVDDGRVGHVDRLDRVRQVERILGDHDRETDVGVLREPERLQHRVEHLLVALRVELDPAGVALAHRVGVVGPDVPRRRDGPVDHPHHDGSPHPGSPVQELVHEQESLTGGRGVRPCSEAGGADADLEGAVLGLDLDVLRRGAHPTATKSASFSTIEVCGVIG